METIIIIINNFNHNFRKNKHRKEMPNRFKIQLL